MKRRTFLQILGATALSSSVRVAAQQNAASPLPWNLKTLEAVPKTYAAPGFNSAGVQALFYEGLPWQGQPTRVFAWIGIPEHKPNEKVPGIVLVHGGGATAYANWVRQWNRRGYAAIAMDTCGSVPGAASGLDLLLPRHDMGGPPGWGGFNEINEPISDQWPYHAVADVVLAHSLLGAQPGVDAARIGTTGVSWGGYLACIAASIDARFRFAAPVYGAGFLGEDSIWLPNFRRMGEDAQRWLKLWDPSQYLGRAKMPFLWVTSPNDFAYPLSSVQKTYRLLKPEQRTLSVQLNLVHGHGGPGENPEEIHVFANSVVRGTAPLTRILEQRREASKVLWRYQTTHQITKAELVFTKETGSWFKRRWESLDLPFDAVKQTVEATLPPDITVYYLNLTDAQNRIASSEHEALKVL